MNSLFIWPEMLYPAPSLFRMSMDGITGVFSVYHHQPYLWQYTNGTSPELTALAGTPVG